MGFKPWLRWSFVALSGFALVGCQNGPQRSGGFTPPLASSTRQPPTPNFPATNLASGSNPSGAFSPGTTTPASGNAFPTNVTPGPRTTTGTISPATSFGPTSSLPGPSTSNLASTARPAADPFTPTAPAITQPSGTVRPSYPAAPAQPSAPQLPGMPAPVTMPPSGFATPAGQ